VRPTTSLLDTKLYAPKPRPGLIARARLIERLDSGAASKLTLLSAGPGFGKSTLLAQWADASTVADRSIGWLALDEHDNEPTAFWTYVINALHRAEPRIGERALELLDGAQPPPITDILTTVLNELAAVPHDVVLVLDDYQAVAATEIRAGMTYLHEHLPARAHLVIATRADPPLPLARLRARGELVEIRAADLRFTTDAAAIYLNQVMGLALNAGDVSTLAERTEGWIAALQLAALSMQGRDDTAGFIATFAGEDRYIVDYLVEEVLLRQPDEIQGFLLETSILDRLSGAVCDAVTGRDDAKVMLEALDRRNLFLVPLDDRRQWYRYHHLFGDVLRARLHEEQAGRVQQLHRRASDWYERHGDRPEAIRHALAAADFERAADLVELALPSLRQARAITTMRGWLAALPDHVYARRPVLSVTYAGSLMANGETAEVEGRLRDAERWFDDADQPTVEPSGKGTDMVVADYDAFRRLPATIAIYRAAQAQGAGDIDGVMALANRALEVTAADDHFERGAASGFLALAHWRTGNLETAYAHWVDTMASLQRAGHAVDALGCIRPLAEIRIAQGRLQDAKRLYDRGLALANERAGFVLRGAADMHVGLAGLLIEWNDVSLAREHLATSEDLGEQAGLALNPYRWRVAKARVREVEGDRDGALELLDEAERVYVGEFYPDVRPVGALRARLWAATGRLVEATHWAADVGISVDDELSYLREFEHVTLARVLMARAGSDTSGALMRSALALLERLSAAADAGGRLRSLIEILVLQAVVYERLGDRRRAEDPLERSLTLAESDRPVRVFVDEGAPMVRLLTTAVGRGIAVGYARALLDAITNSEERNDGKRDLVEPLSSRELDVLRLLATDLDGPGIARELVVGVSTVRSHTKSIYAKLAVNSRRAAVRRAEELGFLSSAGAN
jgi:LuxR family maltose regulon positive regulatory protein